ncbi:MAG: hypothetical protein GY767_02800 [Shimia sp.]|nr:hypothetical protein [Shimia sp.]MCP4826228.1 hypothetical protein [Shimia sp.]
MARVADVRAQEEAVRIAAVKALGAVPPEVGPDVIEAPARGPVRLTDMRKMVRTNSGGLRRVHDGYKGRRTMHVGDAFDVIEGKARAAHTKAVKRAEATGKDAPEYQPPFTPGQVVMGRFYRGLFERYEKAGVRCSSLENLSGGGGLGGEFMDAVLSDGRTLDMIRQRVGSGAALTLRRARTCRGVILDRALVDAVCLHDQTMTDVLRGAGWVRVGQSAKGEHVKALTRALAAALDRMAGPTQSHRTRAAAFGAPCNPIWE